MKELFLKNRISKDKRKREYCIEETVSEGGYLKKTRKNCLYVVKKETKFASWRDVLTWINQEKTENPKGLREVTIARSYDSNTGEGKVLMKVSGTIYARLKGDIFSIKYAHSLVYRMLKG